MLSAMSSAKHQPKSVKRLISDVEPEFPSLPTSLNFPAVQEFARKSQEALVSVKKSLQIDVLFPGHPSIFLPLLSPHRLQQRFNVADDDSVLVVIRKSYPLLKSEIISLNNKNSSGIYVRGPVGVGKSYLLYLLAAEYRLDRQSFRVTYINDCKTWRLDGFGYILGELVTTFYDDVINEKSVVEWCQDVTGSDKDEKMLKMINALIFYVHYKKLQWIVICDQHNALFNPSVVKVFPFSIIDSISSHRGSNIKVVISASANNEGYPTEMRGWQTHDISSHRFDEDEFKVWCDHYHLESIGKVDPESEEAVNALFWTGGVPYELDLLWKQPKVTLVEKTMMYREERVKEMAKNHRKFYGSLEDKDKPNLDECISRMALSMAPPRIDVGMDRQLFDIVSSESGEQIISALNPVARDALITYHGQSLLTSLGLAAELILKGKEFPNAIKGKISEMYITTVLELSQLFPFRFRKIKDIAKIGLPGDSFKLMSIEIKSVVHFLTNKLPPKVSFRKDVTTLFVPDSPNYPRFDFFIWDSDRLLLMGFQVTVLNPFYDHPKMTNLKLWQTFCFGKSKQTRMELYWVVPKCCVGKKTDSVVNDSIILFDDLVSYFPALGKLVLR